jgi:hypothetical protein
MKPIPSVATKGFTSRRVITTPFTSPTPAPINTASAIAAGIGMIKASAADSTAAAA